MYITMAQRWNNSNDVFFLQVYKQKGEEYRIHGQWGWLWLSSTRRVKIADSRDLGLSSGPYKYMVQVKGNIGQLFYADRCDLY